MSYKEQIDIEMSDLSESNLAVVLNFVKNLRRVVRSKPLYSKEEQERVELGYKMLTEAMKDIDVTGIDPDKAKQEYLEGKYGRVD